MCLLNNNFFNIYFHYEIINQSIESISSRTSTKYVLPFIQATIFPVCPTSTKQVDEGTSEASNISPEYTLKTHLLSLSLLLYILIFYRNLHRASRLQNMVERSSTRTVDSRLPRSMAYDDFCLPQQSVRFGKLTTTGEV